MIRRSAPLTAMHCCIFQVKFWTTALLCSPLHLSLNPSLLTWRVSSLVSQRILKQMVERVGISQRYKSNFIDNCQDNERQGDGPISTGWNQKHKGNVWWKHWFAGTHSVAEIAWMLLSYIAVLDLTTVDSRLMVSFRMKKDNTPTTAPSIQGRVTAAATLFSGLTKGRRSMAM